MALVATTLGDGTAHKIMIVIVNQHPAADFNTCQHIVRGQRRCIFETCNRESVLSTNAIAAPVSAGRNQYMRYLQFDDVVRI